MMRNTMNRIFCISRLHWRGMRDGSADNRSDGGASWARVAAQDLDGYNVVNSFEVGYRWRDVNGNLGKYRSDVNFGNGIRLLGSNLSINSKEGHGKYFDELLLNTQGLGNDPYQFSSFRVQKNRLYRYDLLWRENDYYNPALPIAGGQHLMDTSRRLQDHQIVLLPQSRFRILRRLFAKQPDRTCALDDQSLRPASRRRVPSVHRRPPPTGRISRRARDGTWRASKLSASAAGNFSATIPATRRDSRPGTTSRTIRNLRRSAAMSLITAAPETGVSISYANKRSITASMAALHMPARGGTSSLTSWLSERTGSARRRESPGLRVREWYAGRCLRRI